MFSKFLLLAILILNILILTFLCLQNPGVITGSSESSAGLSGGPMGVTGDSMDATAMSGSSADMMAVPGATNDVASLSGSVSEAVGSAEAVGANLGPPVPESNIGGAKKTEGAKSPGIGLTEVNNDKKSLLYESEPYDLPE